jgi:putative transcriptional regulator
MIEFRLKQMLDERGRSAYWLSNQTGIAQQVLSRMSQQKTAGIQWTTLERICKALECLPGDLIVMADEKTEAKRKARSK